MAVYFILGSIIFERMGYYSIANNLVPILQSNQTVEWNSEHSSTASLIFVGVRYLSTLVLAAICDAKLGRSKTIIIGFVLYLTGYIFVMIIATGKTSLCTVDYNNKHNTSIFAESCSYAILGTLICVAVAAGTTQANMAVFGAEQIRELTMISRYADKYIFSTNIGDLVPLLSLSYIQNKSEHYYLGYIFGASMILISILLFLIGWRYYIHVNPYDTVITKFIPVIANAFQTWYQYRKDKPSNCSQEEEPTRHVSTFLDFAKVVNNGKFNDRIVDDVKSLGRPLIIFTLLLPYWLIYNQERTNFLEQGKKMKLPYDSMPRNLMILPEPIIILTGIIILDTFVYKHIDHWKKERILATKFILGMCIAFISMCVAGIIEIFRQENCIGKNESSLSIFYQLPQYTLIGFSELFCIVASYEFAYFAALRSAQSLFMSFRFSSVGVASFINIGLNKGFLKIADDDSNSNCLGHNQSWRYYIFFFMLATIQLLFIIIFILCYKKFRIIRLNVEQLNSIRMVQR